MVLERARPVAVELVRVRLALREPVVAAHGTETDRELVLVRAIDSDGREGWGECAALSRPTYTHEWTDGAWQVLAAELVPAALAGSSPGVHTHPMAAASLDTALVDLALQRAGRSLANHLGAQRTALEWCAVLGIEEHTDRLLARVGAAVDAGASMVKLKVRADDAAVVVRTVREAFPSLALAVDANGSFADQPGLVESLDQFDLRYVEQPLAADALLESSEVAALTRTAIALDESLTSVGVARAALALGAGHVCNVKPGRLGGLEPSLELARYARSAGAQCFVGGMYETAIGRAVGSALAACDSFTFPCDLGPSERYFAHDVAEPIVCDPAGHLVVPTEPGIGRAPTAERLSAVAVDRVLLAP